MKLFLAEVRYEFVVAAESEIEAIKIAQSSAREVVADGNNEECDITGEVRSARDLPWGWDEQCLAYAARDAGDASIGDILQAIADAPTPDTKTLDMFAEVAP